MEVTLTISKESVYDEVAKTTEYTGAKMDDEHAYEVISTTEEDKTMLERFWNECKNMVCNSLKKVLVSENEDYENNKIGGYLIYIDGFKCELPGEVAESVSRHYFTAADNQAAQFFRLLLHPAFCNLLHCEL